MSIGTITWVDVTDAMLDSVSLARDDLRRDGLDMIEILPSVEEFEFNLEPGLIVIGSNGVSDAQMLYVGPLGQIEQVR